MDGARVPDIRRDEVKGKIMSLSKGGERSVKIRSIRDSDVREWQQRTEQCVKGKNS